MLLPKSALAPLLACPRCHKPLEQTESGYRCADPECPISARGIFPTVSEWSALVDFDRSVLVESELTGRAGGSAISRSSFAVLKTRFKHIFFPPNHVARHRVRQMRDELKNVDKPVVLVVGGGSIGSGIQDLYQDDTVQLIGFDIYGTQHTQFIADAHHIPLLNESVDAVLIQAVLEHVLEPRTVAEEIYRVLKPNGLVYADTPFMQQVHEGPYDFTRFTESGHRYLFRKFERIASGVVTGPGTQLSWSIEYAARSIFRSRVLGKVVKFCFFWVVYLDRIIPAPYALDGASAVFFLGRKSDREVTPKEMIAYYQGAQ
jgi:SAM-dependent methyltransferase